MGCSHGDLLVELAIFLGFAEAAAVIHDADAQRHEQAAIEAGATAEHGQRVDVFRVDKSASEVEFDVHQLREGEQEGGAFVLAQQLHKRGRGQRAALFESNDVILGGL